MSLADSVASNQRLRTLMRETIRRSEREGVEMAFPLCVNGEGLVAGERETTRGTDSATQVVLGCPITHPGAKMVGTFHVHVKGPRWPSRKDIANSAYSGEKVFCTGQKDTVVCLEPKPGTGPDQTAETVDQISYYTTPWSTAPDAEYNRAVDKHFLRKEFSLQ